MDNLAPLLLKSPQSDQGHDIKNLGNLCWLNTKLQQKKSTRFTKKFCTTKKWLLGRTMSFLFLATKLSIFFFQVGIKVVFKQGTFILLFVGYGLPLGCCHVVLKSGSVLCGIFCWVGLGLSVNGWYLSHLWNILVCFYFCCFL